MNISFKMDAKNDVYLDFYTLNGNKLVRRLTLGEMSAGDHTVTWDGTNLHGTRVIGGIYLIRLHQGNEFMTVKLIML